MAEGVFTPEKRAALLAFLETGRSVVEACKDVGVSRATVYRFVERGREEEAAGAGDENAYVEFASAFDAVADRDTDVRLTDDDVIRLLEKSAIKGSVQAQVKLLEKPWLKKDKQEAQASASSTFSVVDFAARRAARRQGA